MKIADFNAHELARFKALRRASHKTLVQVAGTLKGLSKPVPAYSVLALR